MNTFGGIDFSVVVFILAGIMSGISRGFFGALADFISISLSLVLASVFYTGTVKLLAKFRIIGEPVDIVSYVSTCLFVFIVLLTVFLFVKKQTDIRSFVDRMFGGILGVGSGIIIASGLLILLSSAPDSGKAIDRNKISPYITTNIIPKMYETLEKKNIVLPKMIALPAVDNDESVPSNKPPQFIKFNFLKLAGTDSFIGYFPTYGAALRPVWMGPNGSYTIDESQLNALIGKTL